jgi:hypothetical protein
VFQRPLWASTAAYVDCRNRTVGRKSRDPPPLSHPDPKESFSDVRLLEEWFGEVGRNADDRFNLAGMGKA